MVLVVVVVAVTVVTVILEVEVVIVLVILAKKAIIWLVAFLYHIHVGGGGNSVHGLFASFSLYISMAMLYYLKRR